jgi:hypothetical protein
LIVAPNRLFPISVLLAIGLSFVSLIWFATGEAN